MDKHSGTSRDTQAIERKKEILKAAESMFAEKGYHATSIRSINQAIGVADGLTYHYFPKGKFQILQTIINEGIEQRENTLQTMIEVFNENPPLDELLFSLSKMVYKAVIESRESILIALREKNFLEENDKEFNLSSKKTKENIDLFFQSMIKYLHKRRESGQIKEMDFEMAISQFFSSLLVDALRKVLSEEHNRNVDHYYISRFVDFTLKVWS